MKPSYDIPPDLLDNGGDFTASLFSGLSLKKAASPLVVGGRPRDYLFPTLYADVRCAVGIFHCSLDASRAFLKAELGQDAEPPRLIGGRSIVAISCYEYRKVRGVRPYNEIAIALPLRLDGRTGIPVLGAFAGGPESGYHIASMPVTSDENRQRGHFFWNLPKITRRIDIAEEGGTCRFESYAEDGSTLDLSLSVPTSGKSQAFSVRSFLATRVAGELRRNPTAFEGDFLVKLNAATLLSSREGRDRPALVLGRGEASDILRRLEAETVPLQTRYASSMNSWFDLAPGAHEGE